MRKDGLIQAGPSPESEVVASRDNVTPFSRKPAHSTVAALRPETQHPAKANPKQDRMA
jgi:hypothetical protein